MKKKANHCPFCHETVKPGEEEKHICDVERL